MGHKKDDRNGNQKQKTDAASFHRLESPSGRQQSALIHSTRTSCSQRGFGQRVPEYHCMVVRLPQRGTILNRLAGVLSQIFRFTILAALFAAISTPSFAAGKRRGRRRDRKSTRLNSSHDQ